jgi:hypothetical protein
MGNGSDAQRSERWSAGTRAGGRASCRARGHSSPLSRSRHGPAERCSWAGRATAREGVRYVAVPPTPQAPRPAAANAVRIQGGPSSQLRGQGQRLRSEGKTGLASPAHDGPDSTGYRASAPERGQGQTRAGTRRIVGHLQRFERNASRPPLHFRSPTDSVLFDHGRARRVVAADRLPAVGGGRVVASAV